jgi:hypothetical protein
MSMQRLTVKQLIKELLDCDMDDEVHIELHTYKSGTAPRKSAVWDVKTDGYSVILATVDTLINSDSLEWEIKPNE